MDLSRQFEGRNMRTSDGLAHGHRPAHGHRVAPVVGAAHRPSRCTFGRNCLSCAPGIGVRPRSVHAGGLRAGFGRVLDLPPEIVAVVPSEFDWRVDDHHEGPCDRVDVDRTPDNDRVHPAAQPRRIRDRKGARTCQVVIDQGTVSAPQPGGARRE
jgi:hypothetical protein